MPDFPWIDSYPKGVRWDAELHPRPVAELLAKAAEQYGARTAIDFLGKTISYNDMHAQVCRLAKGLQNLGIEKGKKIGLMLPNVPAYALSYYALLKMGAVVVNFNPLYSPHEVHHQITDAGIDTIISLDVTTCYDKLQGVIAEGLLKRVIVVSMAEELPKLQSVLFQIFKRGTLAKIPHNAQHIEFSSLFENDGKPAPVKISPRDTALLQYTGGTTGVPKAAELSHANISVNTEQSALWFYDIKPGLEKMLGVLPFFHAFANITVLNFAVYYGLQIIMLPRFEIKQLMKTIDKKKPDYMPGVPTMFNAMLHYPARDRYDLRSIKACISGGAALPVEVKKEFEAVTGCELIEGYGLTETSPVASANPYKGKNKIGSIGLPFPQTEFLIEDMENRGSFLGIGEKQVGEICIRGPQVMKGYFNRPDETQKVLKDGILRTGDIGYIDAEGYVYVVDRLKDMIITGGYNVYPRNVEEVLYQHPDIKEAAVIGIKDEMMGEIVKAFVVLKEGKVLGEADVRAFLKDKLVKYAQPRKIEFMAALPKTMIGKINKKELPR